MKTLLSPSSFHWIEPLESRIVYSITLTGIPTWIEEGPGPIHGGNNVQMTNQPQDGGVQAMAADPTDANHFFLAAVNGGIWRTHDGGATWTPLTDFLPAQDMGDIEFSPLDATNNTLWAGIGRTSNGRGNGGSQTGVLMSSNDGATWTQLGTATFAGLDVLKVLPTSVVGGSGEVVLAGTAQSNGLFRSDDGGSTWTPVSGAAGTGLPAGGITDLIEDPNNANLMYAALPGLGVFTSTDAGLHWAAANTGLTFAGSADIKLALHDNGGTDPVYAAVIGGAMTAPNVFFTTNSGGMWNQFNAVPNISQGKQFNNLSIGADPSDETIVYVSGDRGPTDNLGNLVRGDTDTLNWTQLDHAGANNTTPHPDSRDIAFTATGALLLGNDGGIYKLANPNGGGTTQWSSLMDNAPNSPRMTELYSVAYDHTTNAIFGGAQDNGSPLQSAMGSFVWDQQVGGDGTISYIGADGTHYNSSQNLGNNNNNPSGFKRGGTTISLIVNGTGGMDIFDVDTNITFAQPYALNAIDGNRMIIGTNHIYESSDKGDHLDDRGALAGVVDPAGVTNFRSNPIAYGGTSGGVDNADVLWAGAGGKLYERSTGTGLPTQVAAYTTAGGASVVDVAMDPTDWHTAFVVDSNNKVWETTDTGATWTDVTSNIGTFSDNLRTVLAVDDGTTLALLVGGNDGVFRAINPDSATPVWSEFGQALPNTIVRDLVYDSTDDIVVAGTWGRGAWAVTSASTTVFAAAALQITGDTDYAGEDDTIKLVRDPANNSLLDVFINNPGPAPTAQLPLAAIPQINVDTLGGKDLLILDSTNGVISIPNGTRYDGGLGHDAMQLLQTGGSQTSDVYSVGANNGDGSSVIASPGGTQTVLFQNIEPVLDLVPALALTVNGTPASNAINYSVGNLVTTGLVTIDNFESIEFSHKTALTINGLAGSDEISLTNGNVPDGLLAGITVDGGDPTGSDKLILTGTSGADAFTFAPTSLTAGAVTGVVQTVNYLGIEHVVLDGAAGDDIFNLDAATGSVSLLGNAGVDRVNFATSTHAVVFDLDAVGAAQRVSSTDAVVTLLDRLENFTGTPLNDVLHLTAAPFARSVDGGGNGLPPGDQLFFDGQGAVVVVVKSDSNTGTIKTTGYANVAFDEFESLAVSNSPSGPGGFGTPADSNAFDTAHVYNLTQTNLDGDPIPRRAPISLVKGDLNGDGFDDLISADTRVGEISVLLNDKDGTFSGATHFTTGGKGPQDLVVGFFDGDAFLDVAVTNRVSNNVAVLHGDGIGGFGMPTLIKTLPSPSAIAVGRLNGDALDDVVVTHTGSNRVSVLLGTGAGLGMPNVFRTLGGRPLDVVIADFNNDGNQDVVTANNTTANISFFAGDGSGALPTPPTKFSTGALPTSLTVGDFNGDGIPDIAVSHLVRRLIGVLMSNGMGPAITQFQPQLRVALPGLHSPITIVSGDFNSDGIADLGLGNSRGTTFTILLGDNLGKFTQPYEFDLGKFPSAPLTGGVALGDFNNDGLLDIAAAVRGNDDIRVLLRRV